MREKITIQTTVNALVAKVWDYFTLPEHIKNWNNASADWHTTDAQNDLRVGGTFSSRMEPKDGSGGFDFAGVYDEVVLRERIVYTLGDGRRVIIVFTETPEETTEIVETFEAESENSSEMQRAGWQAILDNFKAYAESK